jgi:hypothetical protein
MIPLRHGSRLAACTMLVLACGGDEVQSPGHHTPVSYTILIDSVPAAAPYTLGQAQAVRMQIKFLNTDGDDLDEVEGEHFGRVTFSPASLATVERDPAHNYRFTVTGGEPGSGSLTVSFGHDEEADETSFPEEGVTIEP